MKNDFDSIVTPPKTVAATMKFIDLVYKNFAVVENIHPGFASLGSMTLVDRESDSAITIVIVESDDED